MNKIQKNVLMNLYFLKQLIKKEDNVKIKTFIEQESGLSIEQLIENPTQKEFSEVVSNFTLALAQIKGEDLSPISREYIELFNTLYYKIIDLENNFITAKEIIKDLNILFRFPLFEATLLHYVQNEMIKDQKSFNNVVLSTYIHISHIKMLCLIDQIEDLEAYLYEIGIDGDGVEINLDKFEVELIKALEFENKEYYDAIINYFNTIANEVVANNISAIVTSCEYVLERLSYNAYIKNII